MTRHMVNPLLLFLMVWSTTVTMYLAGVWAEIFTIPDPALWAAVLLSVGGFSLGYLTWSAFRHTLGPAEPVPSRRRLITPERITLYLHIAGLMGMVTLALGSYRIAMIASRFGTSVPALLSDPDLLRIGFVVFTTEGVFQANWMVMLISVTSALFSLGFILLGVLLHIGTGWTRHVYLVGFLLISLGIGMTSVSRYETTVNILYIVLAYAFVRSQDPRAKAGSHLLHMAMPMLALAALFVAIDTLLHKSAEYNEADRLAGFLYQLFWYLASPLAALNELLTTFDGHYHLGQYTFFPFYKWLHRFGLVPETNISVFGEFVFVPYVANVYTWLRNFYEDFGLIGVTAAPYALGLTMSALRTRAAAHLHYLILYIVLLVFIAFSFYNYLLFSSQVYLQVLFGFLFLRHSLPGRDGPAAIE